MEEEILNDAGEDTEIKPISAETDNASDMPKPVEISMPSADDGTASRYDFDNTNDTTKSDAEDMGPGSISPSPVMPTMDASENSNTPEAKEDELKQAALNTAWQLKMSQLAPDEAEKARDYLMKLPARMAKISERLVLPEENYVFKWVQPALVK